MIKRDINLLKNKTFFLFGARGTGKTTLLSELFRRLQKTPNLLIDLIKTHFGDSLEKSLLNLSSQEPLSFINKVDQETSLTQNWCYIDEIQKLPELLEIVQQLYLRLLPPNFYDNLKCLRYK